MKKLFSAAVIAATVFSANTFANCDSGERIIKFSFVTAATGHPKGDAATAIAKRINNEMNGKACMQLFPSSQLFDDNKVMIGYVARTAILPQVDKAETSKVNCIIGRYSLKDGLLREKKMVIDTTRMRVKGDAKVDFKKEEVYLYLKSSGKRPEFFSLATPIEVKGKIDDFKIGVAPGGLIGTSIRFITSPLHVPLRRLFSEDLPPGGGDVCEF